MAISETHAGSAERLRVVVAYGTRRHDAAIPIGIPVGLALERLGLDLSRPETVVIGSDGDRINLAHSIEEAVSDGGLITVVETGRGSLSTAVQRGTGGNNSVVGMRAWWFTSAFAVVAILIAALGLIGSTATVGPVAPGTAAGFDGIGGGPAAAGVLSPTIRIITAVVLGVIALIALLSATRDGSSGKLASSLTAPPLLAFAAAVVAVDPSLTGAAHLAALAGLIAATVVVAIVHVRRLGLYSLGATGLVLVVLLILIGLWGGTLLLELPATVAAALATGFVPLALRILPTTCLEVPPGYLIEYPQLMTTRWTVRGRMPAGSRPVTVRAVGSMISNAQEQLIAGTIILSALPAVLLPIVFVSIPDGNTVVLIAAIVLASAVVLSLGFSPRTATLPVLRWLPRAGAAVVLVELGCAIALTSSAGLLGFVAIGIVVIGVIAAIVVIPVSRGTISISLSRTADLIEGLATVLALPAGFVAANLITILQGMASA